jgi:hypothetical protein
MTALRALLKAWKSLAHKIANFQARLLLSGDESWAAPP